MKRKILKISILTAILAIAVMGCKKDKESNSVSGNDENWVLINGVKWATRNVDKPGTFVANPQDADMFYQWNRKIGWSSTNPMVNSNGGTKWNDSYPDGETWEKANDPSPTGYRVPTMVEIALLLDTEKVSREWTEENGVPGYRFTDKTNGNAIFLPAAGYRNYSNGTLNYVGTNGYYWSSTQYNASYAYFLVFASGNADLSFISKTYGFTVRPVAE